MENTPSYEIENYNKQIKDPEYVQRQEHFKCLYPILYNVDNNFAYCYDIGNKYKISQNVKLFNFVPTYDNWCLACDYRDCKLKCSKCKSVYFCDSKCQKKAYKIHKKHCGRNLFQNCMNCGKIPINRDYICNKCPVKFCSKECYDKMYKIHKDHDCDYFSKTFGEKYLDYN